MVALPDQVVKDKRYFFEMGCPIDPGNISVMDFSARLVIMKFFISRGMHDLPSKR